MQHAANSDEMRIASLIHRYARLIDTGDFDGIVDLFEGATIRSSGGDAFSGRETLDHLWRDIVRTYEDGGTSTKHLITNLTIDIDEDRTTAQASSYVTVLQARPPELPLQVIASSRHEDRFARDERGWRFVERTDFTDLVGEMSFHVDMKENG